MTPYRVSSILCDFINSNLVIITGDVSRLAEGIIRIHEFKFFRMLHRKMSMQMERIYICNRERD
jgi:hypothetical protein